MSEKVFFEQKVAEIYRRGNKTKGEAIREAAAMYPEAHAEYIERVNRGGASLLDEALTR